MRGKRSARNPATTLYEGRPADWPLKRHQVTVCESDREYHRHPRALKQRQDLFNHSPDGFEWGYGGSGPAQLALAILADFTGDDDLAVTHHQSFKAENIATLKQGEPWTIGGQEIADWLLASAKP